MARGCLASTSQPRVIREYLYNFGIVLDEVVQGTPLHGTSYDLVRVDEMLYSPSKQGLATGDEPNLRRLIANGLRELTPTFTASWPPDDRHLQPWRRRRCQAAPWQRC